MNSSKAASLRIYFVIGEVSGDNLGDDLMRSFDALGIEAEPLGLGGPKMAAHGLESLFDISEIAVMGVSGVLAKLPGLLARVRRVADDILEKNPDVVMLIDSPEFAKQVAKRVKKKRPQIRIVKYVCPTVWAWRQGRAKTMSGYLDHVIAILPFEPDLLKELGGPEATYVGHPLARLAGKTDLAAKRKPAAIPTILLMPGSRKSETARHMPVLAETARLLKERGMEARFVLPAVPHLAEELRSQARNWPVVPEVVEGDEAREAEYRKADLAIAASGTAILELAMYGIPTISIYKLDPAMKSLRFLVKAWTAALPNLIADRVIIPERINEFVIPGYLARMAEGLLVEGPARDAQIDGFEVVHQRMQQDESPGILAARVILNLVNKSAA